MPKKSPHNKKEVKNPILIQIKQLIDDREGGSVVDFCDKIGVSKANYYMWVKRDGAPNAEIIARISSIYNVAVGWFGGGGAQTQNKKDRGELKVDTTDKSTNATDGNQVAADDAPEKSIGGTRGTETRMALTITPVGGIYEVIAKKMGERNISLDDLCKKINVGKDFFESIRVNGAVPDTSILIKILDYLGISENELNFDNRPFLVKDANGNITKVGYKEFDEMMKQQGQAGSASDPIRHILSEREMAAIALQSTLIETTVNAKITDPILKKIVVLSQKLDSQNPVLMAKRLEMSVESYRLCLLNNMRPTAIAIENMCKAQNIDASSFLGDNEAIQDIYVTMKYKMPASELFETARAAHGDRGHVGAEAVALKDQIVELKRENKNLWDTVKDLRETNKNLSKNSGGGAAPIDLDSAVSNL
jgi:transcriptional regulator with XRE-family HTH domain